MQWVDLAPDEAMVQALDASKPRPPDTDPRPEKNKWSNRFADQCAIMLANQLRARKTFGKLEVRPNKDGSGRESVTAAGRPGRTKKVDVSVSTVSAGLQLALSLKAGNFPDPGDGGYGKNLTGRLYELLEEVRVIHEYHPHAILVAVYFLPVECCEDRAQKSTFARLVKKLRTNSRRDDPLLATQFNRLDHAYIGLYSPYDEGNSIRRGVCRYFDVFEAPPKHGRPKVETTLSLDEMVEEITDLFTEDAEMDYVEPEVG